MVPEPRAQHLTPRRASLLKNSPARYTHVCKVEAVIPAASSSALPLALPAAVCYVWQEPSRRSPQRLPLPVPAVSSAPLECALDLGISF